jgi:MYXO-CTERM domain-containing protein
MASIRSISVVATAAFALIATSSASAAIINFTYSGTASGTWLNGAYSGQSFFQQAVTISAASLTDLVTSYADGYKVRNSVADVTIQGFAKAAVTSQTGVWVGNTFGRSGFGLWNSSDILSLGDSSFDTWNMQSSLGPITRTGVFTGGVLQTTMGAVLLTGTNAMTFTATVVPAPGAVALVGLAGLAGSRRRRA